MNREVYNFDRNDYLVYIGFLVMCLSSGLYFSIKNRRKRTMRKFILGKGDNSFIIGMSLATSFFSSITLLSYGAETHVRGTMLLWNLTSLFLSITVTKYIFAPMFRNLQLLTSFEYLEMRFNRSVRIFASLLFHAQSIFYLSVMSRVPSVVLDAVSDVDTALTLTINLLCCIMYTTMGGMDTVLWTSTFQGVFLLVVIVLISAIGTHNENGLANLLVVAGQGGRIRFEDFRISPLVPHSFWAILFGNTLQWTSIIGVCQVMVQKYTGVIDEKSLARSINYMMIFKLSLWAISHYTGFLTYSRYKDCDPVLAGVVTYNCERFPLYVMQTFANYSMFPGLFMSAMFCGTLSTFSAGLCSLATSSYHDLVGIFCLKNMSDKKGILAIRALILFHGALIYMVAFILRKHPRAIELASCCSFTVTGTTLGLYVCGMFIPWCNSLSIFIATCFSTAVCVWFTSGIAAMTLQGRYTMESLPLSVANCSENITTTLAPPVEEPFIFYRISYLYISIMGLLIIFLVAIPLSCIKPNNPRYMNPKLFCKLGDLFSGILPKRAVDFLNFHIGENFESDSELMDEQSVEIIPIADVRK